METLFDTTEAKLSEKRPLTDAYQMVSITIGSDINVS
jgi:hypothetical protein